MHKKEEKEGKYYLKVVVPVVVYWVKRCYPIKIMWWSRNPPLLTSFLFTYLQSPIWIGSWKILLWNLFPLHDHSWKIITESLWLIPMSNKRMWLGGMVDLDSRVIGSETSTNSEKRVSFGSRVESKSKNWNSHSSPFNEMWLSKFGDSISKFMGTGINVGSRNWSKLSNYTGVNIKSKMKIESQGWESGSHSHSSSISLNGKLANLSKVWNWSSLNLCDKIKSWSKSPRHQYSSFL